MVSIPTSDSAALEGSNRLMVLSLLANVHDYYFPATMRGELQNRTQGMQAPSKTSNMPAMPAFCFRRDFGHRATQSPDVFLGTAVPTSAVLGLNLPSVSNPSFSSGESPVPASWPVHGTKQVGIWTGLFHYNMGWGFT